MRSVFIFFNALMVAIISYPDFALAADTYKISPITDIADGSLGIKRLYFNLACNERFTQVLTEAGSRKHAKVGILTQVESRDCNDPDRETFVRVTPGDTTLEPVTEFSEVWFCSGFCYTVGGPDMPPYNRYVEGFGTSEKQAIGYLGCSEPYLSNVHCHQVPVNSEGQ
jgi:hypothetical protein